MEAIAYEHFSFEKLRIRSTCRWSIVCISNYAEDMKKKKCNYKSSNELWRILLKGNLKRPCFVLLCCVRLWMQLMCAWLYNRQKTCNDESFFMTITSVIHRTHNWWRISDKDPPSLAKNFIRHEILAEKKRNFIPLRCVLANFSGSNLFLVSLRFVGSKLCVCDFYELKYFGSAS